MIISLGNNTISIPRYGSVRLNTLSIQEGVYIPNQGIIEILTAIVTFTSDRALSRILPDYFDLTGARVDIQDLGLGIHGSARILIPFFPIEWALDEFIPYTGGSSSRVYLLTQLNTIGTSSLSDDQMASTAPIFGVRFREPPTTSMVRQEDDSFWWLNLPSGGPICENEARRRGLDAESFCEMELTVDLQDSYNLSVGRARKLLYQYK